MKTKQRILICTLELASEVGLGNVSLQKIADRVGVRKATLFSHYKTKDEIIEALYKYLREQAVQKRETPIIDYAAFLEGKTAAQVLEIIVSGYKKMNADKDMSAFYRFIYAERIFNPIAAKIMIDETETMLNRTKKLFSAIQKCGMLYFPQMGTAATSFCLTIHELLDLEQDYIANDKPDTGGRMIKDYIEGFCEEYHPSRRRI